jgi:AcrR family transcriptional regulator
LIDSAKLVFERTGFLNARISDIAAEAGISHGAFYHYFESKEQIFREVAAEQEISMTRLADRVDRETGDAGPANAYERIRTANAVYLDAYRSEAAIMKVIEEVSRYDDAVYEVRERRQRAYGELLARSIRKLQDDGLADARVDPEVAAAALGGMVAKFAEMTLVQGYADFGFLRSVDQITLLWANAIGLAESVRR